MIWLHTVTVISTTSGAYRHTDTSAYRLRMLQRCVTAMALCIAITASALLPSVSHSQTPVNSVPTPVVPGSEFHVQVFATIPNNTVDINNGKPGLLAMAHTAGRLFVVEQHEGKIWEITGGTTALWFDVDTALQTAIGTGVDARNSFHGGLRSLAFHPEFNTNGKFYTSQLQRRPADVSGLTYLSDPASPVDADGVVSEWTMNSNGTIDPLSHREVLRIGIPALDHPIKQIAFNPVATPGSEDYGLLYIGQGDGSPGASFGSGQNNDALGKILRIDPLASGTAPYTIPSTNPFVGDASMLDEVFSIGHRNPHGLAFAGDGTFIVADAGKDNAEEVNIVTAGADYGWSQREGTFVQLPAGGFLTGIGPLPSNDAQFGFTYPAAQFGHEGEVGQVFTQHSIAGGYAVGNGSALDGEYLYGEFTRQGDIYHSSLSDLKAAVTTGPPASLTQAATKRAKVMFDSDNNPATAAIEKTSMRDVIDDSPLYDGSGRADLRFGQGPDGEVYVTSKRNNTIYLVTSTVVGGPGDDSGDDPGDDSEQFPRILITADKQGAGNYGWVAFADNTKQWVDATCRADLESAGLDIDIREWSEIGAIADRTPLACADITDDGDDSGNDDSTRPRILITADKQGAGNYGWVEFADNTKQWVDAACRSRLEAAGFGVVIRDWPAIDSIDDRSPLACAAISNSDDNDDSTRPRILITADKQPAGNYGWVEFADNTKQWVDADCRANLENAGLPTSILEWPTIDAINDRPPVPCANIAGGQPRVLITADKQGPGNYGWVQRSDGNKQWVDASCRAILEASGLAVVVLEWVDIASIADGVPVACDAIN